MIELLLEPFTYMYMQKAVWVSALVGGACAFLSAYLMLKGWSLMGNALGHAIVPGVAMAYLFALPYAIGAFFAGILAALSMAFVKQKTHLKEDAIIGLVFSAFFAIGLLIISINPTSINIQTITMGNILAISNEDMVQVIIITAISLIIMGLKWKDFVCTFFDEAHAKSIGLPVNFLKILFFTILSAMTVAALQTVGVFLVIAMVITPGTTAYLLTDRFGVLIIIAIVIGTLTSGLGAYLSYFLNVNSGGLIVSLQTALFLLAFFFAPKYGLATIKRKIRQLQQK